MSVEYRAEIDGLRALAVSAVVFFHAKIPGFAGGFVGVDIFFVISGFLITSIILGQKKAGRFTYIGFIGRRARRILPALAVVMITCIPFAHALMLPDPLQNFGQSLVATAFSANNVLLWLTSGYWDLASEFKPLLHTWSLGVEEQFYIFFPFVLLLTVRMSPKGQIICLFALAALSFGSMLWTMERDPTGAFYLFHNRAWQLLIGCAAAIMVFNFNISARGWAASVGVALMVTTILGGEVTVSLMPWSLVAPTVGTLLFLLFSDVKSLAMRPFTWRPVIFVGLVSYSFYLWHQPVFAFTRIALFDEPDLALYAIGILVAFGLAVLTWRFVEQPFRDTGRMGGKTAFASIFVSLLGGAGIGMLLHTSAGLPGRMDTLGQPTQSAGATIVYNERIHGLLSKDYSAAPGGIARIAIVGNSFARDFANVLLEAKVDEDAYLLYLEETSSCPQLWSPSDLELVRASDLVIFASGRYHRECVDELDRLFDMHLDGPFFLFVGPKHFGHNLNPLIRLDPQARAETRLMIPENIVITNREQAARLGARYVDLISVLSVDGMRTRVANDQGELLTTDRIHLSKAGAIYVSQSLAEVAPDLVRAISRASDGRG